MDEDSVGGVPWFTATATAAANRSEGLGCRSDHPKV